MLVRTYVCIYVMSYYVIRNSTCLTGNQLVHEMYDVIAEGRTNRGRHNRVHLYDFWTISSKMANPLELMFVQSGPEYLMASENITQKIAIHALQLGLRNISCVTFTRTMNLSEMYGHQNSGENKYQMGSHN
jgi:hypothetical protein